MKVIIENAEKQVVEANEICMRLSREEVDMLLDAMVCYSERQKYQKSPQHEPEKLMKLRQELGFAYAGVDVEKLNN
jgi:hypothetical protein